MSKFYVVCLDTEQPLDKARNATPLNLKAMTTGECESAISWQVQGGWSRDQYMICRVADPELVGVFEDVNTLCPVLISRGPFTKEAYNRYLTEAWQVAA